MTDQEAIGRTLAQYCQFCDDGRFDEWEALFTEDSTFSVQGNEQVGRTAIRQFIEAGQPPERRGRHLCGNSLIDVDGDRASVATDYIFVSRALEVLSAGRYLDVLVRDGDRWLFAERRIQFLDGAAGD